MAGGMSAAKLMKMLEEAGMKYTYRNQGRRTYVHWGEPMVNGAIFTDGGDWSELTVKNATPEQAIAATLGSDREKRLEELVQKALNEGWCDEWWYEDAEKLGLEARY